MVLTGAGLTAAPAGAQSAGQVGVAMGYPASIDVVWHVFDRLALRPELTLGTTSGETSSTGQTFASTVDGWNVGVGLGALVYTRRWDRLRTYVSPRVAWSRSTANSGTAPAGGALSDSTSTVYAASLSFGGQYALGRHFAVFGEVGYAYNHDDVVYTSGTARTDAITRTTGPRTAVGVVLYF
jgi:hypothetical protein